MRVQGPCFNKVSVQNIFQAVRHFPWQQEPLGGWCSVPKWLREQLLPQALRLPYDSLSWLLRHQYRYQHELQLRLATYVAGIPMRE